MSHKIFNLFAFVTIVCGIFEGVTFILQHHPWFIWEWPFLTSIWASCSILRATEER